MLVFMRVRRQQHALILAHIIFRIEEIIGNSLESQLVKTGCIGVSYAIDNYVVMSSTSKYLLRVFRRFENDFIVDTILIYGVEVIGYT